MFAYFVNQSSVINWVKTKQPILLYKGKLLTWRQNIQPYYTHHNYIQYNDTQLEGLISDTQNKMRLRIR